MLFAISHWPCASRASHSGVKPIPYAMCDEEGAENLYTCSMYTHVPGATPIMRVVFKAPYATIGPVALQLNGEKPLPLKKYRHGSPHDGINDLGPNDIRAGQLIQVVNRRRYFLVCSFLAVNGWLPPGEEDCQ